MTSMLRSHPKKQKAGSLQELSLEGLCTAPASRKHSVCGAPSNHKVDEQHLTTAVATGMLFRAVSEDSILLAAPASKEGHSTKMTTTATATSTLSLSAPVMAPIAASSSSSSSGSLGSSCPALERKSSESYCTEALETMVCNSEAFVLSLITEASKLTIEDTHGSPAEYVPKAIAWISVAEGKGQKLMDFCVRREIQHTSAPNLLLREETSFTRAMSLFANLEGFLFLEDVVKPAVKTILSKKVSFEITETKEPSHEERVKNGEAVVKVMKAVLDGCLKNAKKLSQSFRQLFSELDAVTNEKFPGYGKKAAGVCFFLRFLCPNLIHPELYGLVGAVPAEKRRRLIVITQLLQQLVNCWSNDSPPFVSPEASASEDLGPSIVAELLARYAPKIDDFITKHLLLPKKGKKSLTSYMCWKDADAKVDQQAKMLYHFIMHHSSSILPHLSPHDCETLVASLEDAQNKSLKRTRPRAATVVKLVWSY